MIHIPRIPTITKLLNYSSIVKYHVQDLMKRPYTQSKTILYLPVRHLYIDKVINYQQFNFKKIIRVLLQQDKLQKNIQIYTTLFKHIQKNVQKIDNFKSLVLVFTIGYQNNWRDKQMWVKLGKKGFELLKKQYVSHQSQNKSYSYAICKFLIALHKFTGLDKFTNQEFQVIQIHLFKPLFLTYILQLFWKENLQSSYKFVARVLEYLKANQQFIPFSDMHHMLMSKRIIKDPTFFEITQRLQTRIRDKVQTQHKTENKSQKIDKNQNQNQNKTKTNKNNTRIDPIVVQKMFSQYIKDLQAKYL